MRGRYTQQFRLPKMSRRHLARVVECFQTTRGIAPTFCDWMRDRVADELGDRLALRTIDGRQFRGPHERPFLELPFDWSNADLAAALVWCHVAIYTMRDYRLGKLADVLHRAVTVATAARLRRLETTNHASRCA
jgi:hypothetical protein